MWPRFGFLGSMIISLVWRSFLGGAGCSSAIDLAKAAANDADSKTNREVNRVLVQEATNPPDKPADKPFALPNDEVSLLHLRDHQMKSIITKWFVTTNQK